MRIKENPAKQIEPLFAGPIRFGKHYISYAGPL